MTSPDTPWRKPEACGQHGSCIEVREIDGVIAIRRATRWHGWVDRAEFAAFVEACKNGEYDDLCGTP